MFFHRAGAVGVDGNFGQMAVKIRIGLDRIAHRGGVAVQIGDEGLELGVLGDGGGVGLVFFAGQMGAPGRQAGAAGDPQAIGRCGGHVVILHQTELAGGRILVEGEHGDGRRQFAVGRDTRLIQAGVFELHHGEHGIALHTGNLGARHAEQRSAVGGVREELACRRRHGVIHDGLAVDVEVATGDQCAAVAVGHLLASDEKRLITKLVSLAAAVAVGHFER